MALCVFGRVRMSLSLAMRVLVVNIFMFSLFLYPNRHFFMPRVLLQEIERKVLRFLTLSHGPNWECSRQLAHCMVHNFYDFPMSVVSCPLTKPGLTFAVARSPHWDAGDDDTHFFPILPPVGRLRSIFQAYCRNYTFRNFVGSWSSSSKTTFVFCINGWLVQNSIVGRLTWNIGCKHKDGTVPRCVAHYDTCPGVCLNLTDGFCWKHTSMLSSLLPDWSQHESLMNPYNVVSVPGPLIVSTICRVVSQCWTFTTASVTLPICLQSLMVDTASCYKNDGREACWRALSLSSLPFGMSWSPLPFIHQIEGSSTGQPAMSMVGALLSLSLPQTTTTRSVCPPLPTPGVTIYRSDGVCRGQGTIAETLAGWSAAVWSADARGLGAGIAFATARGVLVMIIPTIKCVHVCDSFSALHILWDVRHIYREFNQTADTLSNQAIDERDSNGFSAFW